MNSQFPLFKLIDVEIYERPVLLRLPFRFGVVTLTQCPQAFVRVRIETVAGKVFEGVSAEMMAPKWFDKNLALTNEDNFNQLRHVLLLARDAYLAKSTLSTAFYFFAANYADHQLQSAKFGYNALLANYGPALIDRAILDALCISEQCSVYEAIRQNRVGIESESQSFVKDFSNLHIENFLAELKPSSFIAARHTIGMVDPITRSDIKVSVNDGLPESLDQVVEKYGHTFFKLKVGGNLSEDLERLKAIASVLDLSQDPYFASLDGNEQYENVNQIAELVSHMREAPALKRLTSSILFIEQPINRQSALSADVRSSKLNLPVIIDESDDSLDSFLLAKNCGYAGISSKSCKGIYKSILNGARCRRWNEAGNAFNYFMTGEDLTTQAGISVQQDLALVNLLGIQHVERNGHHYVNGMAALSESEQAAFLHSHSGLYEKSHGAVRLKILNGKIDLRSLDCAGSATNAKPEFKSMQVLNFQSFN
jgi:hypothetical protein